MKNPFDRKANPTFLSSIPFSKIDAKDFVPALDAALDAHYKEIQTITQNPSNPTFENTIIAWEKSGTQAALIAHTFFALSSSDGSDEMEQIAREITPKLTAHQSKLFRNKKLFLRIKKLYDLANTLSLSLERRTLLKEVYQSFLRNGAELSPEKSQELEKVQSKLALHCISFGENLRKDGEQFSIPITDVDELPGLSDQMLNFAKVSAKQRGQEGWSLTLDYPFYLSFMQTCKNRKLRKELFTAFHQRGLMKKETYNGDIIKDILACRTQLAEILGYDSYPSFVLEKRMLHSTEKVFDFLSILQTKSLPIAQKEWHILTKFAKNIDGIESLEGWDIAYYIEQFKAAKLALDTEKLRGYFPVKKVVSGMFGVAEKLFQISFEETTAVDKYHQDVQTFLVKDCDGNIISLLYMDLFHRSGKRSGAWMTSFQQQAKAQNKISHIALICNLSPNTKDHPSKLSFEEVRTLFHEFGHALHGILSTTEFESLSGTQVAWDFVELPSQLMENWAYEEAVLKEISMPDKNGKQISNQEIANLRQSRLLFEGYQSLRQTSLANLDMKWHTEKITTNTDICAFESRVMKPFQMTRPYENTSISTAFAHIFQGGYGVGYYSYKWSEVLASDAFALFKKRGVFDVETAHSLKENILSKGGSEDPEILYKKFSGENPNVQNFLSQIETAVELLSSSEEL